MDRYFAYGCNVEPAHMRDLCPSARPLGLAVLADHRLTFPRRCSEWAGGVASVEPEAGSVVEGVLFAVDEPALAALDAYEEVDVGAYTRVRRRVAGPGDVEPVDAWVYLAAAEPGGPFPPSERYRDALVTGLSAVGASQTYLQALREIRCAAVPTIRA